MNTWNRTALLGFVGFAGLAGCAGAGMAPNPDGAGFSALPSLRSGGAPLHQAKPLTSSGNSPQSIYVFEGQPDGGTPDAGVINNGNTLYGTTYQGGTNNLGTVFSVTTGGSEQILHSFAATDGAKPQGSLLDVKGTLYGTASAGANSVDTYGNVFSITPSGSFKVVYAFKESPDGAFPASSLIEYKGALYGTTEDGGTVGYGTVFKIQLKGKSAGQESVIYSFKGGPGSGPDGAVPKSALVHVGNAFYGTTYSGGANGGGTVFKVTESGTETVLHSFAGTCSAATDGTEPTGGLLYYKGTFYGTTYCGGANGQGTTFSITKAGKEKVLDSFYITTKAPYVGVHPMAPLTNIGGTIYGTTTGSWPEGSGIVFTMTPSGTLTTVGVFCRGTAQGCPETPWSDPIEVGNTLYGTSVGNGGSHGLGTVWALAP
ncbi:MAG: hypothetical protein JOZ77_05845 [Candidatus Eremiobacteraeota bacterium]|nr:hypothetical protein [Candidatus Eremiobacteraeota bacterium]